MIKTLDIFSTEKEPTPQFQKITIDHREKNSLIPAFLKEKSVPYEFEQLPVADYIINNTAIERKTVKDLQASIINKRIFQQLEELKQYDNHLLIIEGIINDDLYAGRIHQNAIRGFLLSLATKFKTPLIYTYDERDTTKYLTLLAQNKEKTEIPLRPHKKTMTKFDTQQFILEGFPGIGPKAARELLAEFRSLNAIFNAHEDALAKILGIKTKDFKELLG